MNLPSKAVAAALGFALSIAAANAAELKVISTIGVKMSLPDVISQFEKTSGHSPRAARVSA